MKYIYQAYGSAPDSQSIFGTFSKLDLALICLDRHMRDEVKNWGFPVKEENFEYVFFFDNYGIKRRIVDEIEEDGMEIVYRVRINR